MAMIILDACNACGECLPACPSLAIRPNPDHRSYLIDPELCGEWAEDLERCGCVSACPVPGCIVRDFGFTAEPVTASERYWDAVLA